MIFMTVFFNVLHAQNLQGIVASEKDVPISEVVVLFQNKIISKTDSTGRFVLPQGVQLDIKLTLEHPDYDTEEIVFSENNQLFFLKSTTEREELNPIVVTAPLEMKPNSLFPSSRLTSASLAQQSPKSLVDAVNKTAGVFIQSGAINTNRITIRGVGSRTLYGTNKIKAYFNGIPITNGVGETAIDTYDPEDLQSIEIIKGPKASLYGTNLGGTILLNSNTPTYSGVSLKNSTTVGSFGLFKNSLQMGFSDKKWTVHFNHDHLELEGFRDNGSYNKNAYFLNTSYQFDKNTKISLLFNHSNYTAHIPSSLGKTDYLERPSKAAFTWGQAKGYEADKQVLAGINITHKFSGRFENSTSVFYFYNDHYEPRPFNILDEYTNGIGLRSVFSNTLNVFGERAVWNFGTELFQDKFYWKTIENKYKSNGGNGSREGSVLSDNFENRKHINVFSDITVPFWKKWEVQFGLNFNDTAYDFRDDFNKGSENTSASRKFDAILAPNLNVSYHLNPQQQFFVNTSYGFNYPSLEEALTPEGIVNPEISPETGYNYEIGSASYFFNRLWHILASFYILDIKNLLVAQRVGDDQYVGRNAGRTVHKGLEISTDYKWEITENLRITPYVNASFNWHQFKEFISEDIDFSGKELTGVPNVTIASGMGINWNKLAFFVHHSYRGEMPMNDANSVYSDAYHLLNLKLGYEGNIFKQLNYNLNFGINNVTDTHYASSILINATGVNNSEPRYYYPGNPRNYYGGVALKYHF